MTEQKPPPAQELHELHNDLVGTGTSATLTDLDKIIGILVVLAEKLEDLDGHSHTIQ